MISGGVNYVFKVTNSWREHKCLLAESEWPLVDGTISLIIIWFWLGTCSKAIQMERRIRNHFFCFQNTQAKSKKERKADPQCPARKLWLSPGAIVPNENSQTDFSLKKNK